MTDNMPKELLPCPFCGGAPTHDTSFVPDWNTGGFGGSKQDTAVCDNCHIRMDRAAWNTRHHTTHEAALQALEVARDSLKDIASVTAAQANKDAFRWLSNCQNRASRALTQINQVLEQE